MKLITENITDVRYITEEQENGKKDMFIEGIFLQGEIKNKNGRIYPMRVLDKEVARYTEEYVDKNRAFGELGHPNGPAINLDRVSHMITSLRKEGSNYLGKAKILDTPMGNIARGIVEGGGQIAVSTRGMGTLKEINGIMEVQDDFFLATAADIVTDPSAPDAFVNGIMEGVDFWFTNDGVLKSKEKIAEEAIKEVEQSIRSKELSETKKLEIFKNYIRSL